VLDPHRLEDLWRRHPGELVGVACGKASGISVLDVDAKHNPARVWWTEHRERLLPARHH
jgi:Bifunctional DNA primase/polymerase, N-terminal